MLHYLTQMAYVQITLRKTAKTVLVCIMAAVTLDGLVVRLQEIPSGDFIRNRLKIEQNYRLFWDIFFSAIMNDLFMTFISRLKVDAKCVYQQ